MKIEWPTRDMLSEKVAEGMGDMAAEDLGLPWRLVEMVYERHAQEYGDTRLSLEQLQYGLEAMIDDIRENGYQGV